MKQTTKTLVGVGAFAAVALGAAFFAAWAGKDEEQKTEAKEKSEKLVDLEKNSIREIKLSKSGRLVADLKRDDEKSAWKIAAPVQADAEETMLNSMLDKLGALKSRAMVEGMDAKQAGFGDEANARLSVTAVDAAGKSATLLFGEVNPFDQSLYVKKAGDPAIRTVASGDKAPFEKELFDLRDKRVLHIDDKAIMDKLEFAPEASSVARVASGNLAAGTFAYEVDRDGNNWKLVKPIAGPADSGAVDRVVASLKNLRAKSVASETADADALAKFGLAHPKMTASIMLALPNSKESFSRKLLIGQPPLLAGTVSIKTYAKRDDQPTIYEVDGQIVKDLSRTLFDLQDKTQLKLDRELVQRIEYAAPGKETLVIMRTKPALQDGGVGDETFTVTAPQTGPAKRFKISGNLSALTNLRAAAIGDLKPADAKGLAKLGLDHPRTITLFGDKNAVLAKLLIGGETDGGRHRWALLDGAPRVFEVEKATFDDMPQTAQDAIDSTPPPAPKSNPGAAMPPITLPGGVGKAGK